MLRWMSQRLASRGLKAEHDAIRLISDRVEGNLLAAAQEIDKISLLFNQGELLSVDKVRQAVAHSARYDVYRLTDAALSGWQRRALKILHGLQAEGNDPILVLWAIVRDLHQLITAKHLVDSGKAMHTALRTTGIWNTRMSGFEQALKNHSTAQLYQFLDHAGDIDCIIKGQKTRLSRTYDAWLELRGLTAALAGNQDLKKLNKVSMAVS